MANTAIANDFDQELFSELEEPFPTFANTYGCTICKRRRQELFPANKRENCVGMEDVGRKFKETVCGNASREARIHVLDGKKCLTVKSLFRNVVFTFIVSFYSHIEDTNFSKPYKPYKSHKLYKSCSSSCGTSLIQAT